MLSFIVFSVIFSGLLLYEVRNKTLTLRMALLLCALLVGGIGLETLGAYHHNLYFRVPGNV